MENRRAIEAILFVAEEPIPTKEIAEVMEVSADVVEAELEELQGDLVSRRAGTVLRRVAGGWRMYSHPDALEYVERFSHIPRANRISSAALETLAVIAYEQPVSKGQISEIRGVDSESSIRTLERKGLIRETGRAPGPGSPILYGTTPLFLERLGVDSVSSLPPLADHVPPSDVVETLEDRVRSEG